MKFFHINKKIIVLISGLIIIGLITIGYYTSQHFYQLKVNGIILQNVTIEEAVNKIDKQQQYITVKIGHKQKSIKRNYKLSKTTIRQKLLQLPIQTHYFWNKKIYTANLIPNLTNSEKQRIQLISKQIMTEYNQKHHTTPAYYTLNNQKLFLHPAQGKQYNITKTLKQYSVKNKWTLNNNIYPVWKHAHNLVPLKKQKLILKNMQLINKSTYQIYLGKNLIKITGKQMLTHADYKTGYLSDNFNQLTIPLLKTLNQKYHTLNRSFITIDDSKRIIKTKNNNRSTYGWQLDIKNSTSYLYQKLLNQPHIHTIIFPDKLYQGFGNDQVNNYIQGDRILINLSQQKLIYIKNNKTLLKTNVDTGKLINNNSTPTGTYYIISKERNAHLKGKNDDGSNYDSLVQYWLPITTDGIGLHDAPWQPVFGGKWYIQNGSHGCINLPTNMAANIFYHVKIGTPVIIY